ncbi:MAG: glycosyltransferase [Acidobacteria bacterium]|nr:glycosyltransferase [Acidobacteriota bacterium]
MPYFSVVIPTHNRIAMLERVLDALGQQLEAPKFEVVVIDDGSNDDTAARVSAHLDSKRWSYPLRFESQQNSGPGLARNRGVAIAQGSYIVFIGDDTVPEPRFLAEHARVHRECGDDPLAACLGYTGWPHDGQVTPFMEYINDYGLQFGYKLIEHDTIVPFNFLYTSNISIDRELLASNPFDTSFPAAAWEDIELAFRLDAKGLKIHYDAKAITRHHHPMTIDSFSRRQYTVGRSGAIFFEKHPGLGHWLGVVELGEKGIAGDGELRRLRFFARLGERFRLFARPAIFERLMRQHYLRGLRDGLAERQVKPL